jgi:flagellar motor switch protein FliG
MAKKEEGLRGTKKAAIFLVTIDDDLSAKLFKLMSEAEVQEMTLEIAALGKVEPETQRAVIEEFYQYMLAKQYLATGGIDYAKQLLKKAFGEEKAAEILAKIPEFLQVTPFEFIKKTDPEQIVNYLINEHPQTIALVLSFMQPKQAAMVISAFPPDLQLKVAMRIALINRTPPDVIRDVEAALEKKLSSVLTMEYSAVGGIDSLVEILNNVDRATSKAILEGLEEENPELAEEVKKKMFVFEDILLLDDRSIQRVLREVETKDLALALKSTTDEVKEKIFKNMSKRAAAMLKEDMEYMGPVRLKDVEDAQQKIVNIIRMLEEAGEIIIARGGEEQLIV